MRSLLWQVCIVLAADLGMVATIANISLSSELSDDKREGRLVKNY